MPIQNPAQLAEEFKRSGEFDRLRRELLEEFRNGDGLTPFVTRVEDIVRKKLHYDSKLLFGPEATAQRELAQELDRYPVIERAVSDIPSLADSDFASRIRESLSSLINESRSHDTAEASQSADVDMDDRHTLPQLQIPGTNGRATLHNREDEDSESDSAMEESPASESEEIMIEVNHRVGDFQSAASQISEPSAANPPSADFMVVEPPEVNSPAAHIMALEPSVVEPTTADTPLIESQVASPPIHNSSILDPPATDTTAIDSPTVDSPITDTVVDGLPVAASISVAETVSIPVVDSPVVELSTADITTTTRPTPPVDCSPDLEPLVTGNSIAAPSEVSISIVDSPILDPPVVISQIVSSDPQGVGASGGSMSSDMPGETPV